MTEPLVLATERPGLFLRQLATESDDLTYYEAVQEDPEHIDNYGNRVASMYDSLEKVTDRRLNAGRDIRMGIWDGDELEGSISARFDGGKSDAEIGYWLRKSVTGNGYATLAVKALTPYVLVRAPRVFAEANVDNMPSIRVMERSGYIRKGEVDRDWGRAVVFESTK